MNNIKCNACEKNVTCTELCPAAKISHLSGEIVPTGEELANTIKKRIKEMEEYGNG